MCCKNVSGGGRTVRALLALIIVMLGYAFAESIGNWKWLFYVVGIILILEAIIGYCPLNQLMGKSCKEKIKPIRTKARKKKKK